MLSPSEAYDISLHLLIAFYIATGNLGTKNYACCNFQCIDRQKVSIYNGFHRLMLFGNSNLNTIF